MEQAFSTQQTKNSQDTRKKMHLSFQLFIIQTYQIIKKKKGKRPVVSDRHK